MFLTTTITDRKIGSWLIGVAPQSPGQQGSPAPNASFRKRLLPPIVHRPVEARQGWSTRYAGASIAEGRGVAAPFSLCRHHPPGGARECAAAGERRLGCPSVPHSADRLLHPASRGHSALSRLRADHAGVPLAARGRGPGARPCRDRQRDDAAAPLPLAPGARGRGGGALL